MSSHKIYTDINMSGLEQLRQHQPFICRVGHTRNKAKCRALIASAKPEQLKAIAGVVYNTLKGKVPLNLKQKKYVLAKRNLLRKFINICCSPTVNKKDCIHTKPEGIRRIRQTLTEQRGGFLPALLPLLALAGKAILAGAVSTGAGLAVKKIAGG